MEIDNAQDPAETVRRFFSSCKEVKYAKHEHIAMAGEPLPGVSYIVSGTVQQYDVSPQGEKVVVNVYKPGAFFPMSWALNGHANEFFYEAASDLAVRQTDAKEAVRFLRENPKVALDLLSRVYRGTDGLLRRLAHLMGGTARTRLTYEIINTAKRFAAGSEANFQLPVTARTLAERTGLSPETVSREMGKMKKAGLIRVDGSAITVLSLEALTASLGDSL